MNFDPDIGVGIGVNFRSMWFQLLQSKLKHIQSGIPRI
jgi:hypothetical protein